VYDEELRHANLEVTHFGLLTALAKTGEINQKGLSDGLTMDSTTLTRTLSLLRKQGWVTVRHGEDRRERLYRLTPEGERHLAAARPYWARAQSRFRRQLSDRDWTAIAGAVLRMTSAALKA
jgi:DNA-binding MarR family transcriptional regulator